MSINKHNGMMIPKEEKKSALQLWMKQVLLFTENPCKRTLSRDVGLFSYKLCAALTSVYVTHTSCSFLAL
jgi:hypothetical protein